MSRTRTTPLAAAAAAVVSAMLLLGGLVSPAAASPAPVVVVVPTSDFGTVNFDGGGAWSVSSPSGASWDAAAPSSLFTALPADGAKWTLDIEGKAPGTVGADPAGLSLSTVGYSNADPAQWALSQKIRYQYYLGSGGYPELDAQQTAGVLAVSSLFDSEFSWTAAYVEKPSAAVHGLPTLDLKIQDPLTKQRISFHSNGIGAPALTATLTTIDVSDPAHSWVINSAAAGHTQWSSLTTADITAAFADWEVVSFGPNIGRGADGTLTVTDLTVLDHTFRFVATKPTAPPVEVPVTTPSTGSFNGVLDEQDDLDVDLYVGTEFAGQWVGLTLHSTPTFLGYFLVDGTGIVTIALPASTPSGVHSVAVYNSAGVFQGWISGLSISALAATGVETAFALPIAALALLLGAVMLLVARRRRLAL